MIKTKQINMIELNDWDQLVVDTYGKIYSFQQQDDCRDRGIYHIIVPSEDHYDYENDTIPEVINGNKMGVSFKAWLERDSNAPLNPTDEELKECTYYWDEDRDKWCSSKSHIDLFYRRNFYPCMDMLIDDLHEKGLLPAGDYIINIDW